MLDIGRKNTDGLIKDGSEATFVEDVLEASREQPVIVYFSAAWCGPCKTFGPELERAVQSAGGKVRMVKIDTEANRQLAAQMRIQSIPAVFAFLDGRPVDGFVGAKTGSELAAFIRKLAADGDGGERDEYIRQAEELLERGAAVEAAQLYSAILAEDPEDAACYAGMIRAYLALGDTAKAEGMLNSAPASIADAKEITAVAAAIELAARAASAGPANDLRQRLQANGDDHQARLDLALALFADDDIEGAIDELLELFRRDREWNDGAAREQLFKIFDSQKPNHPAVLSGRRRLSSMIFS